MKKLLLSLLFMVAGVVTYAQSISGVITSEEQEPVVGAVVRVDGTSMGAVTDLQGTFVIDNVPSGSYTISVDAIGYSDYSVPVEVDGSPVNLGSIALEGGSQSIKGVEILADIAIDRKTPVAVSNISGEYIAERTGNQELTMTLATTPSVYASQGSGGFGDSRLTVRGFDDNNVVVMVNGVPVNDMENQSLFWSNWVGLQDVASQVQIQRGLGASMLAVPSIGGTINIISKATDNEKGGWAQAGIGNDGWRKYAVQLSTGRMQGDWAVTVNGSRTLGDGYVDGNYINAYSWFAAVTKEFKNHSFTLTGFGAPQRHGQGFRRTLSTFVAGDGGDYEDFLSDNRARDFNRRGALIGNDSGSANSIRYNSGWGNTDYDVNSGFNYRGVFNQFSNFFHKPQVNLSHYWDVNDRLEVISNAYGSWGRGGGASDWRNFSNGGGHRWFNYQQSNANGSAGPVNWDALLTQNVALNPDGVAAQGASEDPFYFYRASMNHHNYYGLLSKAIYDLTDEITFTGGIDARTYRAEHFRKIIDGFGLTGYQHNDFTYTNPGFIAQQDTRVFGSDERDSYFNRDNTGLVRWGGAFSEFEYANDRLTAALGMSASNKAYQKIQRVTAEGVQGESDWYNFWGGAIKAGASYDVSDALFVYGNAGYLSIQPIFDNVFQGGNNGGVSNNVPGETDWVLEDIDNEKVLAFEAGSGLRFNKFAANLNLYYTQWQDRAQSVSAEDPNNAGETIFGNALGVDALHYGAELDLLARPVDGLELTGAFSMGNWTWQNNTTFQLFDQQGTLVSDGGFFIEDVRVGNAPQTQLNLGGSYRMQNGLGFYANYQHNMDHYTLINVDDRTDPNDAGVDPNKLPDFGLTNAGVNYEFAVNGSNKLRFDFNVNNLMDILYINEARENFTTTGPGQATYEPLQNLVGNFGLGRTWNASARLTFNEPKPKKDIIEIEVPVPVVPEPVDMDRDNDGVIDAADKCPDTPGTVEGCPDMDGDGVIDSMDDCPEVAGLASNSGCPEEPETIEMEIPDADGDGVLDNVDNCPDVAGSLYNAGCPEVAAPVRPGVEVESELNFIAKSILFNTNSDVIKTESRVKLDEIAAIMSQYPNTDFVIEGHTDSVGDAAYNKTLSQKRAQSVVQYLVGKGISGSRLSSIGYGEEQPIADNSTAEGRRQNRRVVVRLGN